MINYVVSAPVCSLDQADPLRSLSQCLVWRCGNRNIDCTEEAIDLMMEGCRNMLGIDLPRSQMLQCPLAKLEFQLTKHGHWSMRE
ncbi:hypothetical protein APA73_20735 [Pseudomonas aeruginosa]|nr:hypothetical protein APA58_20110 [Pseudomonas aeruginosa]KSM81212.1 hypothetical protein APA73_20735 [Pseudomonas aeruginosa]